MGQSWPLFVLFSACSHSNIKYSFNFNIVNWISVDGALGIQTQGREMVDADETTELWLLLD